MEGRGGVECTVRREGVQGGEGSDMNEAAQAPLPSL